MLTKISKLHLSYSTKSCRHTLSPNENILRHIYFFVAFCDNGDRQREPCILVNDVSEKETAVMSDLDLYFPKVDREGSVCLTWNTYVQRGVIELCSRSLIVNMNTRFTHIEGEHLKTIIM